MKLWEKVIMQCLRQESNFSKNLFGFMIVDLQLKTILLLRQQLKNMLRGGKIYKWVFFFIRVLG